MRRRFEKGAGVVGPYGHIVDLKPVKHNVSKTIAKR
jgi:pilus assembly protein CpaC